MRQYPYYFMDLLCFWLPALASSGNLVPAQALKRSYFSVGDSNLNAASSWQSTSGYFISVFTINASENDKVMVAVIKAKAEPMGIPYFS